MKKNYIALIVLGILFFQLASAAGYDLRGGLLADLRSLLTGRGLITGLFSVPIQINQQEDAQQRGLPKIEQPSDQDIKRDNNEYYQELDCRYGSEAREKMEECNDLLRKYMASRDRPLFEREGLLRDYESCEAERRQLLADCLGKNSPRPICKGLPQSQSECSQGTLFRILGTQENPERTGVFCYKTECVSAVPSGRFNNNPTPTPMPTSLSPTPRVTGNCDSEKRAVAVAEQAVVVAEKDYNQAVQDVSRFCRRWEDKLFSLRCRWARSASVMAEVKWREAQEAASKAKVNLELCLARFGSTN